MRALPDGSMDLRRTCDIRSLSSARCMVLPRPGGDTYCHHTDHNRHPRPEIGVVDHRNTPAKGNLFSGLNDFTHCGVNIALYSVYRYPVSRISGKSTAPRRSVDPGRLSCWRSRWGNSRSRKSAASGEDTVSSPPARQVRRHAGTRGWVRKDPVLLHNLPKLSIAWGTSRLVRQGGLPANHWGKGTGVTRLSRRLQSRQAAQGVKGAWLTHGSIKVATRKDPRMPGLFFYSDAHLLPVSASMMIRHDPL